MEWWIRQKIFFFFGAISVWKKVPEQKKSIWNENWFSVLMHWCIPSSSWISPSNQALCVPFLFLPACLQCHFKLLDYISPPPKSHVFPWGQILLKPLLPSIAASLSNWAGIQTAPLPFPCISTGCAEVVSMGTRVLPSVLSIHTNS